MNRSKRSHLWLIILTGLLLPGLLPGLAQPVRAQSSQSAVSLEIQAAFDGFFKFGEWLPLYANVENTGPDLEAELRVRVVGNLGATTYAVPVPLPAGARKRVPIYVLPNSYSREMEVSLVAGGEVIQTARVAVEPQLNLTYLVGAVSAERGGLALILSASLPGQTRPIVMVDLSLDELPERAEGLRSFDLLILNDVDTSSLTQDQRQALFDWVSQGGRLLVGGGAGGQQTAAGLPAGLLPVQTSTPAELETVSALADYTGEAEIRVPGPFTILRAEQTGGTLLAEQSGLPLLVEKIVGNGWVDWSALDLSGSPFDAWESAIAFWSRLIGPGANYPEWQSPDYPQRLMRADQMGYALSNLPALDLPSVQGLSVLLAIYILLVGPVNYLVLRWRKRLDWAWITIPALTVLFSVGALGVGYSLRGTDLIVNKIVMVQTRPDAPAELTSYIGIFSPAQENYEIEVANSGLLSPLRQEYDPWGNTTGISGSEAIFTQGDPGRVSGLAVNQWSMQAFTLESEWAEFGSLDAELHMANQALQGQVTNRTGHDLSEVVLVFANQIQRLGDLANGETAEISIQLGTQISSRGGSDFGWMIFDGSNVSDVGASRMLDVRRTLINTLFQPEYYGSPISSKAFPSSYGVSYRPVVLGWLEDAPPDLTVRGQAVNEQTTGIVFSAFEFSLPENGAVSIPSGMLPGRLVQMPISGGTCGPQGASVWIDRGEAIFDFVLPDGIQEIEIQKLLLGLESDGGWLNQMTVGIYNWESGEWLQLADAALGVNVIEGEIDQYINPEGRIQISLTSEQQGNGMCYYLGLGLQGVQ